jgi:hypothetical protein
VKNRRLIVGLILACVGVCLLCTGPAAARAAHDAGPPGTSISVQGNQLLQNGEPFVPRGVQITGLVAPNSQLAGKYVAANAHFGTAELQQAVADHANLIRFQVSEFGLNPSDPLYDPTYVQEVQQGVELARSLGLNVIISLQAEAPAGNEVRCPLPDAGAATDWSELTSMFGDDDGIMFELYNEPFPQPNSTNWQLWLNGGPITAGGTSCTAVGMQTLVDQIRAQGADNVIILPGLDYGLTLAGMPTVTDPTNPTDPQLAYSVHYPALNLTTSAWDLEFGNKAGTAPVIVTEWQANSTTNCVPDAPSTAPLLLDYLAGKGIGVVGFAFDLPGTIIADYTYAPTTYSGFACGVAGGGAGQILFNDFAGEAAQQSTSGLEAPRAWLVSVGALTRLTGLNASVTANALNTPRTFVINASSGSLAALGVGNAVPTAMFTSETTMSQAIASGALPPGTQAVELVLGATSPQAQQTAPLSTFQQGALVAHSAGLLFVAAPQLNLMKTLAPKTTRQNWNVQFLRQRLAALAARNADAVVLPFTDVQVYNSTYSLFAEVAAQQVQSVKRNVEVLAGMSVKGSDSSALATPRLSSELQSSSDLVDGYNLTDGNGSGDASALTLLQWLYPPSGS